MLTSMILRKAIFPLLLLVSLSSEAWNAEGHQVIAHIAYKQLNPQARATVDELISLFSKEYREMHSLPKLAIWPVMISAQKVNTFANWHYIRAPFSYDQMQIVADMDEDNALWAVSKIKIVLKNKRANPFERARFLALLTHIVGDLHAPLHTANYYSKVYPNGDQSGHLYLIQWHNNQLNLHHFWDEGAGSLTGSLSEEAIERLSNKLISCYPQSYFGNQVHMLNHEIWASEGMCLAQEKIYTTAEHQKISDAYEAMAKKISEQQIVLAGYRLGNLLNDLLN